MNLSTFLGLNNPVLNFLNFLSSRVLLSNKLLSYKENAYHNLNNFFVVSEILNIEAIFW